MVLIKWCGSVVASSYVHSKFWGTVHHLSEQEWHLYGRGRLLQWIRVSPAIWIPGRTHVKGQGIYKDAQVEEPKVLNKLELLSTPGERARATGTSSPFWGKASTSPFDRFFTHSWPRRLRGAPPSPTAGTRIVDHANYPRRCPATVIGHG
jgi:hypothetical protein